MSDDNPHGVDVFSQYFFEAHDSRGNWVGKRLLPLAPLWLKDYVLSTLGSDTVGAWRMEAIWGIVYAFDRVTMSNGTFDLSAALADLKNHRLSDEEMLGWIYVHPEYLARVDEMDGPGPRTFMGWLRQGFDVVVEDMILSYNEAWCEATVFA